MSELKNIRDYLRFAVSRFRQAGVVHGHGTTSVIDEAAFIILETLHLPVDDINPWLDATLLRAECLALDAVIEARISSRKPAAYLLKKTYMHGVPFYVDERVIVPRSYIGDILMKGDITELIEGAADVRHVLDLCTGSGCLAILAAMVFPHADVMAVELSADALDVAHRNIREHKMQNRVTLLQGDLFQPVGKQKFDLIIANPPYVAQAEVDAFPLEYSAEPQIAHLGGTDGLDIVRTIIRQSGKHLDEGGSLLCEIGTGRDILESEFPDLDFMWLDTEESEGEIFLLKQ